MENKISYLNRTYSEYKQALIEYSKKYFPDITIDYDDASVASWLLDVNADIADNLTYHIDRAFQETNINSATEPNSLFALARNNGVKVPGPKGAMAEVRFTCQLPLGDNEPNWDYAPVIKVGTKVSAGSQVFEVLEDIDFSKQFDVNGNSDRTIVPVMDSNGIIKNYKVSKLGVVTAGEMRIYKQVIYPSDIKPFMEVIIPVEGVMNVESVLVFDGTALTKFPTYGQFYTNSEEVCSANNNSPQISRFFEVDSLAQQTIWGVKNNDNKPVVDVYSYDGVPTYSITRGEWKNIKKKFITEYTDKGYMKLIFGCGVNPGEAINEDVADYNKYIMSQVIANDSLGELPKSNSTMYVLYRVGGGKSSNVAKGAINTISLLNVVITGSSMSIVNGVKKSLTVENTTPSVSGKDMPTPDELRYIIKYNKGAQERCVTTKDYIDRILRLPPKYGTPFRVNATEANNKMMIHVLGLNNMGKLDKTLPTTLIENMMDYLAAYRMINDFIEIKSGRIVNLSFDIEVAIDKNYNMADVIATIIDVVNNYMDINKHAMGENIYVGDIKKEISKIDGVVNLSRIRIWNECDGGEGYSTDQIQQELVGNADCADNTFRDEETTKPMVDLEASDDVLFGNDDTMFEIKFPEKNIRVIPKRV